MWRRCRCRVDSHTSRHTAAIRLRRRRPRRATSLHSVNRLSACMRWRQLAGRFRLPKRAAPRALRAAIAVASIAGRQHAVLRRASECANNPALCVQSEMRVCLQFLWPKLRLAAALTPTVRRQSTPITRTRCRQSPWRRRRRRHRCRPLRAFYPARTRSPTIRTLNLPPIRTRTCRATSSFARSPVICRSPTRTPTRTQQQNML